MEPQRARAEVVGGVPKGAPPAVVLPAAAPAPGKSGAFESTDAAAAARRAGKRVPPALAAAAAPVGTLVGASGGRKRAAAPPTLPSVASSSSAAGIESDESLKKRCRYAIKGRTLSDVRLEPGTHMVTYILPDVEKRKGRRGHCELCKYRLLHSGIRLGSTRAPKTAFKCSHCNVPLCVNQKRNCFEEYHKRDCSLERPPGDGIGSRGGPGAVVASDTEVVPAAAAAVPIVGGGSSSSSSSAPVGTAVGAAAGAGDK